MLHGRTAQRGIHCRVEPDKWMIITFFAQRWMCLESLLLAGGEVAGDAFQPWHQPTPLHISSPWEKHPGAASQIIVRGQGISPTSAHPVPSDICVKHSCQPQPWLCGSVDSVHGVCSTCGSALPHAPVTQQLQGPRPMPCAGPPAHGLPGARTKPGTSEPSGAPTPVAFILGTALVMGGLGCPRSVVTECLSQSILESGAGLHPWRQHQDQTLSWHKAGSLGEAQKCISNVAASQENQCIIPEESHLHDQLALQGYAGRSWPYNHTPSSPTLHPLCRMLHALLHPQTVLPAHEVPQGACTGCCSSTLAVPQFRTSSAGSCPDHSTQTGSGDQESSNPATLSH